MVLINDNWEEVRDLEDVSKIIREYFNEDLAYEMDKMIPEHTDKEYRDLEWQLEEKDGDITSLEDKNDTLKNRIEILEDKIEELEENANNKKPLFHVEIRRQRMKVILQYTDCMSDDKNIFGVLAKNNVEVIKTKQKQFSIYPLVTIRVKDTNTLNKILEQLNEKSVYGVRIVKVKSDKSFIEKLKMLFK